MICLRLIVQFGSYLLVLSDEKNRVFYWCMCILFCVQNLFRFCGVQGLFRICGVQGFSDFVVLQGLFRLLGVQGLVRIFSVQVFSGFVV